jgi:hypothetical protein
VLDAIKLKVRRAGLAIRTALVTSMAFLAGCDRSVSWKGVATDIKDRSGSKRLDKPGEKPDGKQL